MRRILGRSRLSVYAAICPTEDPCLRSKDDEIQGAPSGPSQCSRGKTGQTNQRRRDIPCIKLISVPYVGSGLGTATPGSELPTPGKPQRLKYATTWKKPRRNGALRDDSSSLLQLLIPYFYYLPASGSPESSRGCENWPMCPSGRGDEGESNRPATNFPGFSVVSNRVDRMVEETGLARRLESLIKQD